MERRGILEVVGKGEEVGFEGKFEGGKEEEEGGVS